jgi:isochorismate hydrolase
MLRRLMSIAMIMVVDAVSSADCVLCCSYKFDIHRDATLNHDLNTYPVRHNCQNHFTLYKGLQNINILKSLLQATREGQETLQYVYSY